jgi:hypothetical protein
VRIAHFSIGAAILSHHVDKFAQVAAFFLFSVACLNMTLGLIFREHAKPKRSIRAWRTGDDAGNLPMHTGDLAAPRFRPSLFGGKRVETSDGDEKSNGLGFGRKGEKQAGLKGTRQNLRVVRFGPYYRVCFFGRIHDLQTGRNRPALFPTASQSWQQ